MGTDVDIVVVGPGPSPSELLDRLRDIESLWSRFRPDSELRRLAALAGAPTVVSPETAQLVQRAVYAAERSGGRFDPTVLEALVAAGYDRPFDDLPATSGSGHRGNLVVPGVAGITVDTTTGMVMMPAGVGFDPGGIGKGLAADLVALEAVEAGAEAAMVCIGGDLRVAGSAPSEGWEIAVDHGSGDPVRLNLRSGAVATSSVRRRRWATPTGFAHHVIDPRTGRPSTGPAAAVSVVAPEAWWAEALATTVLVGFGEPDLEAELPALLAGAGCMVTTSDGARHRLGPIGHLFDDDQPPGSPWLKPPGWTPIMTGEDLG